LSRNTAIVTIRLVLTALSFGLYATAVIALQQDRTVAFLNEENGPIPAAVSHWLYGTSGGLIDTGVFDFFLKALRQTTPTDDIVDQAVHGASPRTGWFTVAMDGQGVGDIVATELAFALFGPRGLSLTLLYLLLIGLSTISFVLRYRDERMSAAPILLLALTLLLFTPLLERQIAQQAPIGGIRYYAVVGILPALHWCLEFGEKGIPGRYGGLARWGLLGVQLAVMALAIVVRGSPFYLLLPLAASVWRALRRPNSGAGWRSTATYLCVPVVVLVFCLGILPRVAYPVYAASGRLYVEIWHKVFAGFGTSPYFPFPGLREAYPCPDMGPGLAPGTDDTNGLCVWWSYVRGNHIPTSEGDAETYSGEYERVLRDAVFYVARYYPGKVLKNTLYYKPLLIVDAVATTWPSLSSPPARPVLPLALLQFVLFIGFVAARPAPRPFRDAAIRLAVLLPFLISVQIPLLIAWARPWTIIDLLTYLFCGVEIGLWLVLALCFKRVRETDLFGKMRAKLGYGD
jgi:hypothetical protein